MASPFLTTSRSNSVSDCRPTSETSDDTTSRSPSRHRRRYTSPAAHDTITRKDIEEEEIERIFDRLHKTETISFSGHAPLGAPRAVDEISRPPANAKETREIFTRLYSEHTKSSAGGVGCRPWPAPKPPGYGLKAYPVIQGIETRFKGGARLPSGHVTQAAQRLHSSHTRASSARIDQRTTQNPR